MLQAPMQAPPPFMGGPQGFPGPPPQGGGPRGFPGQRGGPGPRGPPMPPPPPWGMPPPPPPPDPRQEELASLRRELVSLAQGAPPKLGPWLSGRVGGQEGLGRHLGRLTEREQV
jgi:hypothetical protein